LPDKLEKELTLALGDGSTVDLSAIGATLYATRMSTLIYARNKFNKLLEDRTHQTKNPDRVKGIERRKELTILFQAISAAELKKGVKALNLPEGTKSEMVTTLIERFAAKRKRRAQAQPDEE
jgi:hypothetical protein